MKKRRGFTLIEMVCAMAIAGIVITVVANLTVNTLHWGRWGFEGRIIGEQFEQALDLIEEDVRQAVDIDVSTWSQSAGWTERESTLALRLWTVDATDPFRRGQVSYSIATRNPDTAADTPSERPAPKLNLLRAQKDETHSGANQPVVSYLNSILESPPGLQVYYYDRAGTACTLGDDIYSVRVVLNGTTETGKLVTRERTIPLATKFE